MRKKAISISCSCIIALMLCMFVITVNVHAEEKLPQVDGSYLTNEEESIGYAVNKTRGEDLLTGYSKIARLPNGNLYVGGSTIAAHTVERIGIAVIVERLKEDEDGWGFYDSWMLFHENADKLSTAKEIENPEGGYYYRVACTHSAGNDVSSSYTDGVYVEKGIDIF